MRIKIIAVNALIVAVVGLLSFLLVRSSVGAATSNKDQLTAGAQGDVNGAAGWVQLDGLRAERWLAAVANEPATVDALSKATASARGDAATQGVRRPREPHEERAALRAKRADARRAGRHERSHRGAEQLEPRARRRPRRHVRRAQVVAGDRAVRLRRLVRERPLPRLVRRRSRRAGEDHRRAGHRPTARRHALARQRGHGRPAARARGAQGRRLPGRRALGPVGACARRERQQDGQGHAEATRSRTSRPTSFATAISSSRRRRCPAFEDGKRALLVAASPGVAHSGSDGARAAARRSERSPSASCSSSSAGGCSATTSRGRSTCSRRGCSPSSTARPTSASSSTTPSSAASRSASISSSISSWGSRKTRPTTRVASRDPRARRELHRLARGRRQEDDQRPTARSTPTSFAASPPKRPTQYYARIYREYIAAKRAIGEPTDHISEQAFAARIQSMEQDAAQKYGRPVRYQVHARNKEVVLLAVPL